MPDELSYLDDLVPEGDGGADATTSPPPPPPAPPSPPPATTDDPHGFFAAAPSPAAGDTPGATGAADDAPDAPPGGRFRPPSTTPVVRRPPASNRLGPVALFCGTVALLLGLALPFAVLLILITAGGGLIIGGMTLRHAVNTGAPGRWLGLGGMTTGLVGVVLMFVAVADAGRAARSTGRELAGMMGDLEMLGVSGDVRSLTLPGTGTATITLDDVTVTIPLDGCGFSQPVPGVGLAGHGTDPEDWRTNVAFSSKTLGTARDVVVVDIGGASFGRRADGELFVLDGDRLLIEGEFRELSGSATVPGRVEATCSS